MSAATESQLSLIGKMAVTRRIHPNCWLVVA